MLTLFTIPRAFHGHLGVIQRNAIQSWLRLRPACEVLLFGDDPGTSQVASELSVRHVAHVQRNAQGTPLLNDLFAAAERAASYPLLCYVNADIILMADFLRAVRHVNDQEPRCLMVCRRWDIDLSESLAFHPGWEKEIAATVAQSGRRRPHTAIDCFVFPPGLWKDIPPMALGRGTWDNWLIYGARAGNFPVVDLSDVVCAVHQNHDYAHQTHDVKSEADVWSTEEAKHNWTLGGGYAHAFSAYDATHTLTRRGLKRNLTPYSLYRKLAMLSVSHPFLTPLVDFVRAVYQRYPALRRAFLWRISP
jgi:hypothetical protein